MKILYLCPDIGIPVLGSKGGAVHVREMVAAFSRAGGRVVVAAPRGRKSPWEAMASLSGEFLQVPFSPATESSYRALASFIERIGEADSFARDVRRMLYDADLDAALVRSFAKVAPDFIYARSALFSTAPLTVARQVGCPLLVEVNAPIAAEQEAYRGGTLGGLGARAEAALLRGADAVLTVSAALKEHILGFGVDPDRVHVVPNGIDPAVFAPGAADPALRARWKIPEGPVLGFVGGLRPWHGVEVLPQLLDRLTPRHPAAALVIVGDGPLRAGLEQALDQLGLRARAVFTGAVHHEEIPGLMRLFDVALAPYPPLEHVFYFSPLKLFEYMACGVPVVASRSGQIGEVIESGATGLLYPPGDFDALAAACDRLLANADERRAMGERAARLIHGKFTWDHNARRAMALARAVASNKAGPS
ncbi:MAG TPA: glycosyltransferase family 4 protein [Burkholderiales bacterium]